MRYIIQSACNRKRQQLASRSSAVKTLEGNQMHYLSAVCRGKNYKTYKSNDPHESNKHRVLCRELDYEGSKPSQATSPVDIIRQLQVQAFASTATMISEVEKVTVGDQKVCLSLKGHSVSFFRGEGKTIKVVIGFDDGEAQVLDHPHGFKVSYEFCSVFVINLPRDNGTDIVVEITDGSRSTYICV
jgi:hypothetical protein